MKVVYAIYVTIAITLIGRYGIGITRQKKENAEISAFHNKMFYGWIGLLVFTGVGIHIMTFNIIPWVKWDLNRDNIKADQEFNITVADYKFHLPEKQLIIKEGQTVRFNLESKDYTYGFGLFRKDGSLVFQMQVVPGNRNDLVWKFDKTDTFSIRSTEYSGPKGGTLFVKNAVVIASEEVFARLKNEVETKSEI
jgi:cytochrome c oxidase subunit 2